MPSIFGSKSPDLLPHVTINPYFFTSSSSIVDTGSFGFKISTLYSIRSNSLGLTKLGEVKHLPPTVTANYFFATPEANFQPYAGIGLNYTVFFDEEFTATNEELGFSDLDLDGSFGLSAQAGFDYKINEKWFVNGSVRYIDISTDADFTLNNAGLGANNANGTVRVDIDPMVYTLSIGYKL